jgi:hypothetical protein
MWPTVPTGYVILDSFGFVFPFDAHNIPQTRPEHKRKEKEKTS